jgi:phosphoribosyl 1,2-cyclic phosphodiesterase
VQVHFCGSRGSSPAPGLPFARYGGHTSCLALTADGDQVPTLLLDAGTGVRQVTALLQGRPYAGHILLTHLHWDHWHGLPFFRAGDTAGAAVTLLLPDQQDGMSAEAVLERGMSPPHFPIGPRELRGSWEFGLLSPGTLRAGAFTVQALEVPHKGGRTYGYRVSDSRSVIAYIPDHCPTELGPGPDGWGEYHPAAMDLAAGADLLVHDAFLFPAELHAEAYYGHAAADYAVGLGLAAGARRVVLFHHRPERTDAQLDDLARRMSCAPVPVTVAAQDWVARL